MIQVRKVKPEDLQYLFEKLSKLSFDKASILERLDETMIVINSNQLCGVGAGLNVENKCLLNWIYIEESFRRDRMGTALVKTILSNGEQKGALQAYIIGECGDFAEFLGFQKVEDAEEQSQITSLYKQAYGSIGNGDLYKVSLIDYFKPCNHR